MTQLTVSLACQNSDRTRPLLDGRVRIEGVTFHWVPVDPEEIFHRAFRNQEFDVCEISLATHLTLTSRAGSPFTGVPAFCPAPSAIPRFTCDGTAASQRRPI